MVLQNLHAHSRFDDGTATCEEMVRAAAAAGLKSFGISAHSPMPHEPWTVPGWRMGAFQKEMARLKAAYAERLTVWTGLEYDLVSEPAFAGFDYVIASVHAIDCAGKRWAVDHTRERAQHMIDEAFRGDRDAAAAHYFSLVQSIADIPEADIVGHFDLLTKFNEPEPLYDTASPAYRRAALAAMEALVQAGKIFEINTGAVSRGYRTDFYPDTYLLNALREMGGRLILSSDSHAADTVTFGFAEAEKKAKAAGFDHVYLLTERGFVPTEI